MCNDRHTHEHEHTDMPCTIHRSWTTIVRHCSNSAPLSFDVGYSKHIRTTSMTWNYNSSKFKTKYNGDTRVDCLQNSQVCPKVLIMHVLKQKHNPLYAVFFKIIRSRPLRSSSHNLLEIPRMRTGFAQRSFTYSAPHIWNSLPLVITDNLDVTANTFKKKLETFLLH